MEPDSQPPEGQCDHRAPTRPTPQQRRPPIALSHVGESGARRRGMAIKTVGGLLCGQNIQENTKESHENRDKRGP